MNLLALTPLKRRAFSNLYAYQPNGSDEYAEAASSSHHDFASNQKFTVGGYVKFHALQRTAFIEKMGVPDFGWALGQYVFGGTEAIYFQLRGTGGGHVFVRTNVAVTTGVTYHVAATYNGDRDAANVKIYINGSAVATTIVANSLTAVHVTTNSEKVLLARDPGDALYSSITMDEICVWDDALTAGEVAAWYNSGVAFDLKSHSKAANLKSWWKLEQNGLDEMGYSNLTFINGEAADFVAALA